MSDVPVTPRADHQVDPAIHTCEACASGLVQPTDWTLGAAGRWTVLLRCPECEWRGERALSETDALALSDQTEHGTEALMADLQALAHANRESEIELFVAALDAGLIGAEDFATAPLA